jgi:hypothetical protein
MSTPDPRLSRREFLGAALAAPVLAEQLRGAAESQPPNVPPILTVDRARLLAAADLVYEKPPARSEEGIPVGNGRVGSLVWTTPDAIRLQVNRADVYANDSATTSFFERHSDYCGGCAFVDVALGGAGRDVFPASGFRQRLSVHDGLLTLDGAGVTARVLAWPQRDVMAIAIDDRREAPEPMRVDLRMLRYASQYFGAELERMVESHTVAVQTRNHRAESRLEVRGGDVALAQEFREGRFVCRSAVVARVVGRPSRARVASETTASVTAPAGRGPLLVLVASAASFDEKADVVSAARAALDSAEPLGMRGLAAQTAAWWHDFWSRGLVHLRSTDGVAERVARHYHWFLYVMGASSRGALPPKFNGMLWNTGGDLRTWGAQHWFANLSCYYEALPASNHVELTDPAFDMYSGMRDACAAAARQQWGSEGIYIPETTFFDGLAPLPDDVAAEMRALYTLRKPWAERSARFVEYASVRHPHSSRWNWIESGAWVDGKWTIKERGAGPFGAVTHILGTTAKVAYLYWRRYEYTLDRAWLAERAYPMLRGAAEFYRHFPGMAKGDDGRWHLRGVNSNESVWGATDTDEDMSALRGLLPAAIRASELLGVDTELRAAWRELLGSLAPIPTSDDPRSLRPADYRGPRVFSRGLRPVVRGEGAFLPDRNSLPMWFFDLCGVEARDRETLSTAAATFDAFFPKGITADTPVSVLSKEAIAAASLGRADAVRHLVPSQIDALRPERGTAYRGGGVLANRMTLREGPQALDAQRLGRAAEALQLALLQSAPPAPAEEPIIHVFPAWPAEWDADYTLRARGAFLVTSSVRGGRVGFVELESLAGGECRLRNPWRESSVVLWRDGARGERLTGSLLTFATRRGERVVVVPDGDTPAAHRHAVP